MGYDGGFLTNMSYVSYYLVIESFNNRELIINVKLLYF